MNKTNIYVSVRTEEDQKRFLEIAKKAKEPINPISEEYLENGHVSSVFYNISFTGTNWSRCGDYYVKNKTLITLDQLESMLGNQKTMRDEAQLPNTTYEDVLCGKGDGETLIDAEKLLKSKLQIIANSEKPYVDWKTLLKESRFISEYAKQFADQQTSSLRKELEEKEKEMQRLKLNVIEWHDAIGKFIKHMNDEYKSNK